MGLAGLLPPFIRYQLSVFYGGPQLSRQNQKPHGKNKTPHEKTKYPRQNQSYFVFVVTCWCAVKKLECVEFVTCEIVARSVASRPKKERSAC